MMSPAASLCLFVLGVARLANAAPAPAEPEGDNVDRAAKVAKFLYDALNAEIVELRRVKVMMHRIWPNARVMATTAKGNGYYYLEDIFQDQIP